MKKALVLGITGSFFFAFTFVLNRSMNLGGGYWLWSAVLRYLFTLPMMALLLLRGGQLAQVLRAIQAAPGPWLLWSSVGFGLFYAPLCAASVFAESWFVAAMWQFTIVAGVLLTPLFGRRIPLKNLLLSCLILVGIFVMQIPKMQDGGGSILPAMALIVIAAFSYPLGNRKMMLVCPAELSTIQRVFGMTLCSMPFWLILGAVGLVCHGAPGGSQMLQSLCVALFSGVIATILFFRATDLVKHDQRKLAVIEATQSGEVIFTLLLGVVFLHDAVPSPLALLGIALIVAGMIANSLAVSQ